MKLKDEVCNYIIHVRMYKQIIIPNELIGSRGEGKTECFNRIEVKGIIK
jgi:hypothetical protein